MATLFVDKIDPQSGSSLEIGSSGDTITTATGAKPSFLYPAFSALASGGQQNLSDATETLVVYDHKVFDTDNCFDNTAGNYKFTPNLAGKYFLYFVLDAYSRTDDKMIKAGGRLYKNGARINSTLYNLDQGGSSGITAHALPITQGFMVEANGSSDYFQVKVYIDVSSGTGPAIYGNTLTSQNVTFAGYRIGT